MKNNLPDLSSRQKNTATATTVPLQPNTTTQAVGFKTFFISFQYLVMRKFTGFSRAGYSNYFAESLSNYAQTGNTIKCFLLVMLFGFLGMKGWGQTYYSMSNGTYSETFTSWTTPATGTNWSSVAVITNGTIPIATTTTVSSSAFAATTSAGLQNGSTNIQFLSTSTTSNTVAVAFDLNLNFSGRTAGTFSFDAATVFNTTGDRVASLKVYYSLDGTTWTELTGTNLPYVATNNVVGSGAISIALPAALNNQSTVKLRFYNYNGTATGTAGSRPKISIDNVAVTSTAIPTYTSIAATDWNTASTWSVSTGGNGVPAAGSIVVINTNVTASTTPTNQPSSITINNGFSWNLNAAYTNPSGSTITVASGATLAVTATLTNSGITTVNGTFQVNQNGYASGTALSYATSGSTLIMNNSSGQYGISTGQAFWPITNPPFNVTINGATGGAQNSGGSKINNSVGTVAGALILNAQLDVVASAPITVNGTFQLNSNGYITTTAPTYGGSSTLIYNTGYTAGTEWTGSAASGAGVPQAVTIQNNSAVNFGSSANYYYARGLVTIASGSGLTLSSDPASSFRIAGGLTNNNTGTGVGINTNGRSLQVFGNGTYTKVGTDNLDFLLFGSANTLTLASNTNLNLTNTAAAGALQFNVAGILAMTGTNTVTLAPGTTVAGSTAGTISGNSPLTSILSLAGTCTWAGTSATVVAVGSGVGVQLNGGLSITTASRLNAINVQINEGGFISTNPIVYGTSSTLVYNHTNGTYGVGANEFPSAAGPTNLTINANGTSSGISFATNNITTRTLAGTLTLNHNLVLSGSGPAALTTLNTIANSTAVISGTGTYTQSASGSFTTAHTGGINGTVTTTTVTAFPITTSFTFNNGTTSQVTGTSLPGTIAALTINNPTASTGTTISNNTLVISGVTTLTAGALVLSTGASNLVTFTGAIGGTSGTLTGSSTSNIITSANITTPFNLAFTTGGQALRNWTIGSTFGVSTPTPRGLSSDLTINGTLQLSTSNDFYILTASTLTFVSGSTFDQNFLSNSRIVGAGSVNFQTGSNLLIGHSNGLTTTAAGAVQVTGTRTFSGGANYTFNNTTTAQGIGDALDAAGGTGKTGAITGNIVISNLNASTGVTLNTGTTLTINSPGSFNIGVSGTSSAILTADGTSIINGTGTVNMFGNGATSGSTLITANASGVNGTFASTGAFSLTNGANNNTNFTFNGTALGQVTGAALPATINNLIINNATVGTASATPAVLLSASTVVNGTLTFTAGHFSINDKSLTCNGPITTTTANRLVGNSSSNFTVGTTPGGTIGGSGLFGTIGGGALNNFSFDRTGQTIFPGTTLAISGATNLTNGLLRMDAGLTLSGAIAFGAGGQIRYSTAAGLTINGTGNITGTLNTSTSPLTMTTLTMSRSGQTLTLGTDVTVSGSSGVALTGGIVDIAGFNLTTTSTSATIYNPTNGGMIKATGNGQFFRTLAAAGTPTINFPIGDGTNYTPVQLTFTLNPGGGTVGVKTVATTHLSINTGSTPVAYTSRYWTFTNTLTTYTYSGTFSYISPGDVTGTESNLKLSRYNGSAWIQFAGSSVASPVLSSGSLTDTTGPLSLDYTGRANSAPVNYVWNGTTTDWNTASNWSPNGVPTALDNVTINGTSAILCSINSGSYTVNDFTLNSTGTFAMVSGTSLTINGNITYGGSATASLDCASTLNIASTSSQTVTALNYGNLNLTGGARVLASSGTIGICGTFTQGAGAFTIIGSTVNFNGTAAQSILTNATTFNNLTISNAGANVTASVALTVTNALTINGSATLTRLDMGTNTLTLTGATANITSGFLRSGGTITGGTISFAASGTYEHNYATTAGTIPTATWNDNSTCSIIGYTSASSLIVAGLLGQSFYNFTWNTPNWTGTSPNIRFDGNLTTVRGNLNIITTNGKELRFGQNGSYNLGVGGDFILNSGSNVSIHYNSNTTNGYVAVVNVGGNLTQNGGTLTLAAVSSAAQPRSATATINVSQNVSLSGTVVLSGADGAGTINQNGAAPTYGLSQSAGSIDFGQTTSTAGVGAINVKGTYSITGTGAITTTGSVAPNGTITFNGGANQTITNSTSGLLQYVNWNVANGSTTTLSTAHAINTAGTSTFTVANGGTLNFSDKVLSGAATSTFVASTGATLTTANSAGINTSGATGSVQTTTRTFTNAGVNYTFNSGATNTGTAIGAATTIKTLTINNSTGVTLTAATTVSATGSVVFSNGLLDIGAVNLILTTGATFSGQGAAKYIKTSGAGLLTQTVAASAITFPVGNSSYNPLTFSNGGNSDSYSIKVVDGVISGLSPADITRTINRSWTVTEGAAGNSTLNVGATIAYNIGEENNSTNFNGGSQPYIGLHNGTIWAAQATASQAAQTFASTATLSPVVATYNLAMGKDGAFLSAPTQLVITTISPNPATAGSGFSATVQAQDGAGNPQVVSANTVFNLTTNANAGTIGGTITGTIVAGQSQVIVSGVTLSAAGTAATVTATRTSGDALTAGNSATFNVLAAASQLAFVNVPATGTRGVNLTTFTVEARRPDNTVDNTYTGTVTLTKASGPGNLTGTLSVAAVAGVATFSAAQFSLDGTFTISAASGALPGATSGNIVITFATAASDYFISNTNNTSGLWSTASSWLSSPTGSSYIAATAAPTTSATAIAIQANHAIVINSSVTVDKTTVNGTLRLLNDASANLGILTLNNGGATDEMTIANGGVLQVFSISAAYSTTIFPQTSGNINISNGGKITIGDGTGTYTGSGYGTLGYLSSSNIWNTGAIFEWNTTSLSAPATTGITYFSASATTIPIFRMSATPSGTFGSSSMLVINGIFEVNTALSVSNSGTKTFRDGLIGTGNVTQVTTGQFIISGTTAQLGGSGSLILSSAGLSISGTTTLVSDKVINLGTVSVSGTLDAGTNVITGTTGLTLTGTLKTANANGVGISATGTLQNSGTISLTVGTVDFSSAGTQTMTAVNYGSITNSGNGARTWASSGIIDINAGFAPTSAINTITGSTVKYSSTAASTFSLSSFTTNITNRHYNNLILGGGISTVWALGSGFNLGIAGDFSLTGAGTLNVCPNITANTMNVDGNFIVGTSAGKVNVTSSSGVGTLNVTGNFTQSGTGTITISGGTGLGTANITGNLAISNGTINGTAATTTSKDAYIYVGGTYLQTGGVVNLQNNTSTSGATVGFMQVTGDFTLTSGTFEFATTGVSSSSSNWGEIDLKGNFVRNGAANTLKGTGSAYNGSIYFIGNTPQTINVSTTTPTTNYIETIIWSGSNVSLLSNYKSSIVTIDSGGTLLCGNNAIQDATQVCVFTNNGTLGMGSPAGIVSGTTLSGNIQGTGTRTFAITGNYIYNGTAAQVTGSGLPATVNNLTINNSAADVKLSQGVTVNGNLTFTSGNLDLNGSNNITLGTSGTILTESNTARVINTGTLTATNGWIGVVSRILGVNPGNVANLGMNISVASAMGATTIKRFPKIVSSIPTSLNSISRIYSIQPTTASSGSTIALSYFDGELNSNTETATPLTTYSSTGANETVAANYSYAGASATDATANTVTLNTANLTTTNTFWTALNTDQYFTAQDGDWNTAATWTTGIVPPLNSKATVLHSVTVNATVAATPSTVTVSTGGSLTFGVAGSLPVSTTFTNGGSGVIMTNGGTLSLSSGATLSNGINTFTGGSGTVAFAGTGTVLGTITFNKVTVAGALSFSSNSSIGANGSLQINSGAFLSAAPAYAINSTLIYNSGGTYIRNVEWGATAGLGYPGNVTVQNGTTLTWGTPTFDIGMQGNLNLGATGSAGSLTMATNNKLIVAGNVTIGSDTGTSTLTLSSTSGGDIKVGGNWTRIANGTFTPNTRAVFFTGSGTNIINSNLGASFDYLVSEKTGGAIQLGSDLTVNAPSTGNALSLKSVASFDLNGYTLNLTNAAASTIQADGGVVNFTGTGNINFSGSIKTFTQINSGSFSFGTNVALTASNGVDFGAGLSTINGTLQIDAGGFVQTNAAFYGNSSTLVYNSGTTYGRALEWSATSNAGYPNNVLIQNNTTLDLAANGFADRAIAGNLTLGTGTSSNGSLTMGATTAKLTINGNVLIGGNTASNTSALILSTNSASIGIEVAGNWTRNTFGSFTDNGRATFFIGTGISTITTNNTAQYAYLFVNKTSGGSVSLANAVNVSNTVSIATGASMNLGTFVSTSGTLSLGGSAQTTGSSYGGTGSPAANINTTYFANNTGYLNVGTCVSYSLTSTTVVAPSCNGSATSATLANTTASGLPTGTYTVFYTLTGATTGSYTATMVVSSAGSGTFTTGTLSNAGLTLLNIDFLRNGCVSRTTSNNTATFTVNSASTAAVLSGTTSICSGGSTNLSVAITGGTSPFTVVYSDGTNNFTVNNYTSGANISVSPLATTSYSLVSVTSTGGCVGTSNSGTAVVTLAPLTIGGTLSPSSQDICPTTTPATITLSGQTGSVIKWQSALDATFTTPVDIANTTTTLTLTLVNTTTYYRAVVQSGACAIVNSASSNINIRTATYDAALYSGNTPANWSEAPSATKRIIINSAYNSVGSLAGCSCVVNSGVALTFNAGHTLTLKDALNTTGITTFENNSSLVQVNNVANTGNITYKRTTTTVLDTDFTYWSSPVAGQNILAVSPMTKLDKFFSFDAAGNQWVQLDAANTTMRVGQGYIIRGIPVVGSPPPGYPQCSFIGVPNNGNIDIAVVGTETSNLLGNPYPSAINADAFILANSAKIDGTLYFWTHKTPIAYGALNPGTGAMAYTANDYATYNVTGGVGTAGNYTPEWVDANNNGIVDSGEFTDKNGIPGLQTGEWIDSNSNLTFESGEWTDANNNKIAETGEWTDNNPANGIIDAGELLETNGISGFQTGEWTDTNTNGVFNTGEWNDVNFDKVFNLEVEQISNRPTGKIAAGQGFFTTSTLSGGQVSFTNSMRVDGSGNVLDNSYFYKTKNPITKTAIDIEKNRVWLNLTNKGGAFKQTLLGYVTGATNTWDRLHDGYSYDGNEFADFYSINEGKNLVIQGRALPFDENDEVPLGYRSAITGEFSISIDQVDGLLTNQAVFLEDKLTNAMVNLKTSSYTFTTAIGVFDNRFVLRYKDKTLGTNDLLPQSNKVLISIKNKQIKINSFAETIDKVTIYDFLGRQIYQKEKVNSNELILSNFVSSHQTLIVKTTLQNGKTVSDKIIY